MCKRAPAAAQPLGHDVRRIWQAGFGRSGLCRKCLFRSFLVSKRPFRIPPKAVSQQSAHELAAARGLVAAGIKDGGDVDQVIALLRARGVVETGGAGGSGESARTQIIAVETERDDPENPDVTITTTRLTTRAHVEQESALVELSGQAGRDRRGTLNPVQIKRGIEASGLSFTGEHGAAQRRMIDHLGMGGRLRWGSGRPGPARPRC